MSTPYYADDAVALHLGDCLDVMRALPDCSVDAIVTDPPYGLGFMGKGWDDLPPGLPWAIECLRVLKPGGHLLAFGGSRTWHRLAAAIEDAGFELRDSIAWLYGSGFPKSLDVSKAIDRAAGVEREILGPSLHNVAARFKNGATDNEHDHGIFSPVVHSPVTAPATDAAATWQGWGTALKPAFEPIVVARKPLAGTVAANVLKHGTGALNIAACRVEHASAADLATSKAKNPGRTDTVTSNTYGAGRPQQSVNDAGRWPTNVVLDDTQAAELDRQSGTSQSRIGNPRGAANGDGWGMTATGAEYDDQGGASRFFPTFSHHECEVCGEDTTGWHRDARDEHALAHEGKSFPTFHYEAKAPTSERPRHGEIAHPTVKPLDLMRWLVRLVTPPGGTVLEPFAGSGTTAEACVIEGFKCIAIEREATYLPLIVGRLSKAIAVTLDFTDGASA